MISPLFLAEWALRSAVLILIGAVLLRVLRVKDPSIRLAAWAAILCGSLAIPAVTTFLPQVPIPGIAPQQIAAPAFLYYDLAPTPAPPASTTGVTTQATPRVTPAPKRFDWPLAAMVLYAAIAFVLLSRRCLGIAMSHRLLRNSYPTGRTTEGIEVRESDRVAGPMTLGIVRPVIVLPPDWHDWDATKLDAILAHERSHIRRHDPAIQLLSAIHRALLWHNPLSWFLHTRIVRLAEEASDDAAVAATRDRAAYAQVLLEFMQRAVPGGNLVGVPMARYGRPDTRIDCILDATSLSRGVTRWSVMAILACGTPLAYLVASAHPQSVTLPPLITRPAPIPATLAPLQTAQAQPSTTRTVALPPPAAPKPKFDVASIKLCTPGMPVMGRGGAGTAGALSSNGLGGYFGRSPGRLNISCGSLMSMLEIAYVTNGSSPLANDSTMPMVGTQRVRGMPDWAMSARYNVEAATDDPVANGPTDGPNSPA